MTRPDFHELVSGEGSPEELERLRRVHDLLVAADPPPDLPERLAKPARGRGRVIALTRSRVRVALGLAAAAAIAIGFGIGFAVGQGGGGFATRFSVPMHGVGRLAPASASIDVGKPDPSGNWSMRMTVRGLPKLPANAWYELYLTKHGRRAAACGSFKTGGSVTEVHLSAPYKLTEYDGWVVTARVPGQPERVLLST